TRARPGGTVPCLPLYSIPVRRVVLHPMNGWNGVPDASAGGPSLAGPSMTLRLRFRLVPKRSWGHKPEAQAKDDLGLMSGNRDEEKLTRPSRPLQPRGVK